MEKELKQLLFKDLSARVPYGVMCWYNCITAYDNMVIAKANVVGKLNGIVPLSNGHIGFMVGNIDKVHALEGDIKPYLKPMYSMTEEEREEYHSLCYEEEREELEYGEWVTRVYFHDTIASIDWLNAHHFDYRGLIKNRLAIAVTEENNLYKE